VRVSIKDSSELEASQVWSFSIVVEETEDTADDAAVFMLFGNPISTHTLLLLAVIMCAGGLLIIIPWLLYAMGREEKRAGSEGECRYKDGSSRYSSPY
jgi:hypothetical protein